MSTISALSATSSHSTSMGLSATAQRELAARAVAQRREASRLKPSPLVVALSAHAVERGVHFRDRRGNLLCRIFCFAHDAC